MMKRHLKLILKPPHKRGHNGCLFPCYVLVLNRSSGNVVLEANVKNTMDCIENKCRSNGRSWTHKNISQHNKKTASYVCWSHIEKERTGSPCDHRENGRETRKRKAEGTDDRQSCCMDGHRQDSISDLGSQGKSSLERHDRQRLRAGHLRRSSSLEFYLSHRGIGIHCMIRQYISLTCEYSLYSSCL